MRPRTRTALLALPIALLLTLAACGSGDGAGDAAGEVASADRSAQPDSGAGGGSEPLGDDERHDQLLDYAQCLRDQGLDVDDPAPGEGIELHFDGDPAQNDAALKACEDVAPAAPAGPEGEEVRTDMLDFAQCMRDNGVEAFEDPREGEGIDIGPEIADDPDFDAANETCNEQVFGGQPDMQGGGA